MREILFTLVLILLQFSNSSCSNDENKIKELIRTEYFETSSDNFDTTYILIVSESDCMSCLDAIANQNNDVSINITGFYYSRYPKIFLERLLKSYPNVIWKPLKNKKIPPLLLKEYKDKHGPYIFELYNNKIELIE